VADLIDRISGDSVPIRPKINSHRWVGVQRLYALGEWTQAQVGAEFGITGNVDEERQATQIANQIDAQPSNITKIIYIARVEAVFYCLEDHNDRLYHDVNGLINKTKIFEDLQIAG